MRIWRFGACPILARCVGHVKKQNRPGSCEATRPATRLCCQAGHLVEARRRSRRCLARSARRSNRPTRTWTPMAGPQADTAAGLQACGTTASGAAGTAHCPVKHWPFAADPIISVAASATSVFRDIGKLLSVRCCKSRTQHSTLFQAWKGRTSLNPHLDVVQR